MKKLSVLFSIFAVLMAVTFTSCEDQAKTMEPFTEDMIGEWMIGTWDISSSSKETVVQGEEEQTTESTTTGTYEIKGIEDDSDVISTTIILGVETSATVKFSFVKDLLFLAKNSSFETEGAKVKYSLEVNKPRTKIVANTSSKVEVLGITTEKVSTSTWTKR